MTDLVPQVEAALQRVLDPSTPYEEKQALEQQLAQFQNSPSSCLPLIAQVLQPSAHPASQYILWFACTTIEEYVRTRWISFSPEQRSELRNVVWTAATAPTANARPPFVHAKLLKVVSDVARMEWKLPNTSNSEQVSGDQSHYWFNFVDQVQSVLQSNDTSVRRTGVQLVGVLAEEFGRDDALAPSYCKSRVQKLFRSNLPSLLQSLGAILQQSLGATTSPDQMRIMNEALTSLNHLMQWSASSACVSESWINLLFAIVQADIDASARQKAIEVLVEIVTKQITPQREDLLTQTFHSLGSVLQHVASSVSSQDDEVLIKFEELVKDFVSTHVRRLNKVSYQQSLAPFTMLLLQLTQAQESTEGYVKCLEIWEVFVAYFEAMEGEMGSNNVICNALLSPSDSALSGLLSHLLQKVSYNSNGQQLEELDDSRDGNSREESDEIGDSGDSRLNLQSLQDLVQSSRSPSGSLMEMSERQQFVVSCLSLIQRISVVHPSFSLQIAESQFATFSTCMSSRSNMKEATVTCAVVGLLCSQSFALSADSTVQRKSWDYLESFVTVLEQVSGQSPSGQVDDVDISCELFASVRGALTCVPLVIHSGGGDQVMRVSDRILKVVERVVTFQYPTEVVANALQLMANLGFVVPFEQLRGLEGMQKMIANLHSFRSNLHTSVETELFAALSNLTMKDTEAYAHVVTPVMNEVVAAAKESESQPMHPPLMTRVKRDIRVVRKLSKTVEKKEKQVKVAFAEKVMIGVPAMLTLLRQYVGVVKSGNPSEALEVVHELVKAYGQLLMSVRKELPKDSVAEVMRVFVEIFQDPQLCSILNGRGRSGMLVLCGFLHLLQVVVEEPTPVFTSFVENALDLCYGPLKEPIFSHPESDSLILGYFVGLIGRLLENHFRSFVMLRVSNDGSRDRCYKSENARNYFAQIFQSFAGILEKQDLSTNQVSPALCKQVIQTLSDLDDKQNLLSFQGFQQDFRLGFLNTLMQVLMRGELNMLKDDIAGVVHRLAGVDFQSFFQTFLSELVQQSLSKEQLAMSAALEGGSLRWSGQTDLPTFSQDLDAFLADIRFLRAQQLA